VVYADFLNAKSPLEEVERIKNCLDIAAVLGAKLMRHDASWGVKDRQCSYLEAVDMIAEHIRSVTEYGESLGIKTMTENHGYFLQDSYRMEYLVNKVNHTNYGLLVDIGNFLDADEDPIAAVSRLAPYAMHAHAKDFIWKSGESRYPGEDWFITRGFNYLRGTVVGHGIVPVAQCIKILKNSGYKGDLTIEFEGFEDPLEALTAGLKHLKCIMEED
jgi:sugar phosphate isomerase/epimerase